MQKKEGRKGQGMVEEGDMVMGGERGEGNLRRGGVWRENCHLESAETK